MLFDGFWSGAVDGACGVVEELLLLFAGHQSEQVTGLLKVVVVVGAEVEMIGAGSDGLGGIALAELIGPCPPRALPLQWSTAECCPRRASHHLLFTNQRLHNDSPLTSTTTMWFDGYRVQHQSHH